MKINLGSFGGMFGNDEYGDVQVGYFGQEMREAQRKAKSHAENAAEEDSVLDTFVEHHPAKKTTYQKVKFNARGREYVTAFTRKITSNDPVGRLAKAIQGEFARLAKRIEQEFEEITNYQRNSASVSLDFSAPGVVPGFTDESVTIEGVELGDTVLVGCSITAPSGFMPPIGFVSAANTITVRWLQVTGAAADPDGAGATYCIDVWRH
jgi:hypothetical protein